MAFAQQNRNAPFVSERDLLRQVASNFTKNCLLKAKENQTDESEPINASKLMLEQTSKANRVWVGFTKFIKSQCSNKKRAVDTSLIGLFMPDENGKVIYMPSPDFLEAGKFKLQSNADHLNFSADKLQEKYDQRLSSYSKSDLSLINLAAIGFVAKVSESETKAILTAFFKVLVETSRRTAKEARIELKGLGYLHLFSNRELSFQHVDQFATLTEEILAQQRQFQRDDLSYIDQASATLSQGGGRGFSVRSSTLSKISVRTPASQQSAYHAQSTAPSRASSYSKLKPSTGLKQDMVWQRYKQKNADRFKASASANEIKHKTTASESNAYFTSQIPLLARKQSIPTVPNSRSSNASPPPQSSRSANKTQEKFLPYPFLEAYIERKNGTRFGRRVNFDHSQYDNILEKVVEQRDEKRNKDKNEKLELRQKEKAELDEKNARLYQELQHEQRDKELKKHTFMVANQLLMSEKEVERQAQNDAKMYEKINYFPFTHGDTIDRQRVILRELQKHSIEQILHDKKRTKIEAEQARVKKQTALNREANERMMNQTLQPEVDNKEGKEEPLMTSSATALRRMSQPGALGTNFVKNTSNQRTNKYNPNVLKDSQGALVNPLQARAMEKAMQRHEEKQGHLMIVKEKQLAEHQEVINANKDELKEAAEKKELDQARLWQLWEEQRKDNLELQKQKKKIEAKNLGVNGGPTLSGYHQILKDQHERKRRVQNKTEIQGQIQSTKQHKALLKAIDHDENEHNVSAAKQRLDEDERQKKANKKATQKHFAEVWNQQKAIHAADEQLNNLN